MTHRISKKSVFLIDGSSFLYRAYYGLKPLHTSDGKPIQAVYGFCKMIKKLIDDFDIDHLMIVWDSKGKSFRHEIYSEYKATRQAPPSDIFEQKELIQEFADVIGIKQLFKEGVEADDLLYSAALASVKEGYQAIIVTSDKDMRQILDDHIVIFDPFKNMVIDAHDCQKLYGFAVSKLPFYFSLIGDTSDNIPGVKGIGPKGATDLVMQFKDLDDLYTSVDTVKKERVRHLLLEHKKDAYLSLKLFQLQKFSIHLSLKEIFFQKSDWNKALPFFIKLNFNSLVKQIKGAQPIQQNLFHQAGSKPHEGLHDKYSFVTIQTEQELKDLCLKLSKAQGFALDTETDGIEPMQAQLVGVSIAFQVGTAYYIPLQHAHKTDIDIEMFKKHMQPLLVNVSLNKYMHHAKFDQLILNQAGIDVQGPVFDTLIAASLVSKDWEKNGLKELSERYFCEPMTSFKDVADAHGVKNFAHVPLEAATKYAACDAHQTLKLVPILLKELQDLEMLDLFYNIELPVNQVLVAMQREGIYCDSAILEHLGTQVDHDLQHIEQTIFKAAGKTINLNSAKQIRELLFDTLQLPVQKKSGTGEVYSTDAQVLKVLSKYHKIPQMLLSYRELFKLKSTYIDALPEYINPNTQRIHTSWNQTIVATGRISSSNPNLQNIPRSGSALLSAYDVDVREAFKAKKGWSFISADYSQIELRILAQLSQDVHLKNAFLHDKDIHKETAAKLFEVPLSEVTVAQRDLGKRLNFSILYGLTAYGLSRDLDIAYADAKKYIDTYFKQFPGVAEWMEHVVSEVKRTGYTKTLYGRRRYLPGIYEKNKTLYDLARRIAINTPAQGTAAEIIKIGMIDFFQALDKQKLQGKIILQIHDELLVTCPDDQVDLTVEILRQSLVRAVSWDIPLQVAIRIGKNWKDVTK